MTQVCCWYKNINVIVYILIVIFAIASWVDINGLWVELPILVQALPEAWNLPSYMVVITQLANIGPLAFTLLKVKYGQRLQEIYVIYTIIGIGAVACLLLAFFWNYTSYVHGSLHSTALLILNFFLAIVDCTSSVVFLPFMAHFKQEYITAFFIGEGFSGLLPGLIALGQGATQIKCINQTYYSNVTINGTEVNKTSHVIIPEYETPRFSIEIFFFILFGMLLASGSAFTLLNFNALAKLEQLPEKEELEESQDFNPAEYFTTYELSGQQDLPPTDNFLDAANNINSQTHLLTSKQRPEISIKKEASITLSQTDYHISKSGYILFLVLTAWINGLMNGTLPSIQSYSALPYGNTAYHLAVTLGSIANPLACCVAFFLQASSIWSIVVLTVIGSVFGAYCIVLAAMSPEPLMVGSIYGNILSIAAWFLVTFILTYAKVSIATLLRREGKRALMWCGALTQVGSAVGAIIMFLAVNIFNAFKQGSPCN